MDEKRKKTWRLRFFLVLLVLAVVEIALIVIQGLGVRNRDPYVISIIVIFVLGFIFVAFMNSRFKREKFEAEVKQRTTNVKNTLLTYNTSTQNKNPNQK